MLTWSRVFMDRALSTWITKRRTHERTKRICLRCLAMFGRLSGWGLKSLPMAMTNTEMALWPQWDDSLFVFINSSTALSAQPLAGYPLAMLSWWKQPMEVVKYITWTLLSNHTAWSAWLYVLLRVIAQYCIPLKSRRVCCTDFIPVVVTLQDSLFSYTKIRGPCQWQNKP